MVRMQTWMVLVALAASGCSKATPAASGDGSAVSKPGAPAAVPTTGWLDKLAAFRPPTIADPAHTDIWEIHRLATLANDAPMLAQVGAVPETTIDVFLADARLIAEFDLGMGRLEPATTTAAQLDQIGTFMAKQPAPQLRGYRRFGNKHFFVRLTNAESAAFAAEALTYLKANGFKDPRDGQKSKAWFVREAPKVKATWPSERKAKTYDAYVDKTYGKLVWLAYTDGSSAWMPATDVQPPQPVGPEPTEAPCRFKVGDQVMSAWSTKRDERGKATVTEVYGGMANVAFADKTVGWAHCATEMTAR